MQRSTERFLTTHTAACRAGRFIRHDYAKEEACRSSRALATRIRAAVAEW